MNTERTLLLAIAALTAAACTSSSSSSSAAAPAPSAMPAPSMTVSTSRLAPNPDPRVGLRAGTTDSARHILSPAAEAIWNLKMLSNTPSSAKFVGVTNSDLAFVGTYAIQGNYNGYQVWDLSNPRRPALKTGYLCPASQSDVSVYKNLLFVSSEAGTGRLDCGAQGNMDSVSAMRVRGIRVFDATDIANPKYVANVQTCRGSHTHTVVEDPKDKENIYIYISGNSAVRPAGELAGCSDMMPSADPNSELFRIEVIQVPLAHPERSHVVSKPGILADLVRAPQNAARRTADSIDAAVASAARGGGAGGRGAPAGGRGGAAATQPGSSFGERTRDEPEM